MSRGPKQIKIGTRFERLITTSAVFSVDRTDAPNEVRVRVKCDCGSDEFDVLKKNLLNGRTRSCGCLNIEVRSTQGGITYEFPELHDCWSNMRHRCLNPNAKPFKWYGGKGVTICKEWRDDFPAFVAWAHASGWEEGLELDRIDPDGNYEPSNCRWISKRANLRRAGRLLEDDEDERLNAHLLRTGQTLSQVIEDALDQFLPPADAQ